MAGNGAILDGGGPLADGDGVLDLAEAVPLQLACRERRMVRRALRWSSSSFFSTPRVWMNRLR